MAHEIAHVTARHAAQRAEFVKTDRALRPSQRAGAGASPGPGGGGGPFAAVDRQLLARTGVRGRPDRHQVRGAGGLRPLWRRAVPDRARRMERALRLDFRRAVRRPAGHDGDASLDAGAHRPGQGGSAANRPARRRARPAGTPTSPRSTGSCSATIRPRASSGGRCSSIPSSASPSRRRRGSRWRTSPPR